MRQCRALAILPYSGLESLFKKVQQEYPAISLSFYTRDPEKLTELKEQEQLQNNYDLVITHFRFASERYTGGLPVACMHLSYSDLMSAFMSAKNISGRHAFVTYMLTKGPELAEYARTIKEITRYTVQIFDTGNEADIDAILSELKEQRYSIVIGGIETAKHAKQVGLNALQIPYGPESIRTVMDTADAIFRAMLLKEDEIRVYQDLLDSASDYIALQSADGRLLIDNGRKNTAEFRKLKDSFLERLEQEESGEFELQSRGTIWRVARKPYQSFEKGANLVTFHRQQYVDSTGGGAITILRQPPSSILVDLLKTTDYAHTMEKIRSYWKINEPTLISGERGLGKENVAFLLNQERPLIRIECNNLTRDGFQAFKEEGFRRVNEADATAILFLNADVIIPEIQEELADFLTNVSEHGNVRIISTAWDEIYRKVSRGGYSERLYHLLSKICIDIPPLRSAIGDMDEEIAFIISRLNIELGLQIIGIAPDAAKTLKEFEWGANLQQLIDVLRRTMLSVSSAYIGRESVLRTIETEKSLWSSSRGAAAFWKGDLEEIERRIIRGILEEEGMNQAKAAKRLGISRSTLWRKIK